MTIIRLIDTNPNIVKAWAKRFGDHPAIECAHGDITQQNVDVWVTPTNSKGHMSGGVDAAIRDSLGAEIQQRIQDAISTLYQGTLPIGRAVIVDSPSVTQPKYVVATPSMVGENDNLKRTKNTALACAAAFQAIYYAEEKHGAQINSICIPGLGSGTGQVPPDVCADLMLVGYRLFIRKRYESFDEMLGHLHEELELVGQFGATKVGPQPNPGNLFKAVDGYNPKPAVEEIQAIEDAKFEALLNHEVAAFNQAEAGSAAPDDGQSKNGGLSVPVASYVKDSPIGTPLI